MPFEPDIIISDRDGFRFSLVVEAKSRVADLAVAERQLRRYMIGNGCPLGMIVTPETLRIYRDTYRSQEEDSIARVGEFPTAGLFGPAAEQPASASTRGLRLDDLVQTWLETLRSPSALSSLQSDLRAALEEHVVPALFEGEIRAARPRLRQTGS
jgi:hypothetical protein